MDGGGDAEPRTRRRRYDGPAGFIVTSLKLIVDQQSPADAKVALFRSLFRGREDVYPRRFESRKTGKSGYAPACANEWVRGVCEKPRVKCAECPSRQFLSLNERVIRWHLSGQDDAGKSFVGGVYPMLLDETCFFLAIDFDKQNWTEDAQAYLETCRRMSIPAALERSRSGRGGHVWCFFAEAVPAALARRLGSYVLTESMMRRPDIGFHSYDRFFPSQDTLPRGGFGNLIALPLQKQAREPASRESCHVRRIMPLTSACPETAWTICVSCARRQTRDRAPVRRHRGASGYRAW